jgi:hypothetical protein
LRIPFGKKEWWVRKTKALAAKPASALVSVFIGPGLLDDLKKLVAKRKLLPRWPDRPVFISNILDDAIASLDARLQRGATVSFVPVSPSDSRQTSMRLGGASHRAAMRASKRADVRFADFIRTALTLYLKKCASEIHETSKTPAHRQRGPH